MLENVKIRVSRFFGGYMNIATAGGAELLVWVLYPVVFVLSFPFFCYGLADIASERLCNFVRNYFSD